MEQTGIPKRFEFQLDNTTTGIDMGGVGDQSEERQKSERLKEGQDKIKRKGEREVREV